MSISKISISVTINDFEKLIEIRRDETILETCLRNKLDLPHSCGGFATCGTCRVIVEEGLENCLPRNEYEQEMADDRGFSNQERLACQTSCQGFVRIRVPR